MQRIRLEILTEAVKNNGRLWVLELLQDAEDNFRIYRHYGKPEDVKFTKRLEFTSECFESALMHFEKVFIKKIKKRKYRQFRNGEGANSVGLLNIFRPVKPTERQVKTRFKPTASAAVEHRKLQL